MAVYLLFCELDEDLCEDLLWDEPLSDPSVEYCVFPLCIFSFSNIHDTTLWTRQIKHHIYYWLKTNSLRAAVRRLAQLDARGTDESAARVAVAIRRKPKSRPDSRDQRGSISYLQTSVCSWLTFYYLVWAKWNPRSLSDGYMFLLHRDAISWCDFEDKHRGFFPLLKADERLSSFFTKKSLSKYHQVYLLWTDEHCALSKARPLIRTRPNTGRQ